MGLQKWNMTEHLTLSLSLIEDGILILSPQDLKDTKLGVAKEDCFESLRSEVTRCEHPEVWEPNLGEGSSCISPPAPAGGLPGARYHSSSPT